MVRQRAATRRVDHDPPYGQDRCRASFLCVDAHHLGKGFCPVYQSSSRIWKVTNPIDQATKREYGIEATVGRFNNMLSLLPDEHTTFA